MLHTFLFLLLASGISAQVTTSMWYHFREKVDRQYVGSIIDVDGDALTVAVNLVDTSPASEDSVTSFTYTIGPKTYGSHRATNIKDLGDFSAGVDCTRASEGADATCVYSTVGEGAYNLRCRRTRSTSTSPVTDLPDFCTEISELPQSLARVTLTVGSETLQTFQLVLTAGLVKLSATAGATVSTTDARQTGEGMGGGVAPSTSSPGLAAPTRAANPAFAGLGAAVAAFML